MQVEIITAEEFERHQKEFDAANFLQTAQMGEVQRQRGLYEDLLFIAWKEEGTLVGQALVYVRRRLRVFKEAVMLQGPLFNAQDVELLPAMMVSLEEFLKKQGIARVEMNPYMVNRVADENLKVIAENQQQRMMQLMEEAGYQRSIEAESSVLIAQIFRKNLLQYADSDAVYKDFSKSMQRNLRKAGESHIVIRELEYDDIEIFYSILSETSVRKGFHLQDLSYFQLMKEKFGADAKFMVAFLDVKGYQEYYEERIAYFTKRIEELEKELEIRIAERGQSKKTRGLINDAKDQLASYEKRKKVFESFEISNPMLPLSGYLFMCYNKEVISVFGGSYEEYLNFGGSTILNWEMMKYAKDNGYDYYNFYGTIETEEASQNDGNFNFKRQFGGELDQLVGNFSKTVSSSMKLVEKVKKI